jgi:tetratricopeptide (TPR) repeat protein
MNRLAIIFVLLFLVAASPAAIQSQSTVDSARALFDQGRYSEARSLLRSEIARTPNNPELYFWLGHCEFELYNNDAAINNAEHAVQLAPGNSAYHYFLGTVYGYKAEFANFFSALGLALKTEHEFTKAADLDPHNLPAQRDLISYCIQAPGFAAGGEEKAQDRIAKLKQIDPLQSHLALLELYADKKKWGDAIEEANAVLALKPKDADPYLEIVEYYQNRDEAAEMRGVLAVIPRSGTPDPHINYFRAVADVIAGDHPDEAEALLKAYLAKQPPPQREDHASLSMTHTWLGRLYEKLGRRPAAIAEYHIAIKLNPHEKAAHEALARIGS